MAGIVAHLLRGDLFNHEHFHVYFVMKERKYFGRKSEVFIERVINILEQPPHQLPSKFLHLGSFLSFYRLFFSQSRKFK